MLVKQKKLKIEFFIYKKRFNKKVACNESPFIIRRRKVMEKIGIILYCSIIMATYATWALWKVGK